MLAFFNKLLRHFPETRGPKSAVIWGVATLILLLFLAASVQTVKVDQYPLRSGCSENDPVVAKLHAGDPVQLKFALAGSSEACYVVSATVDGKAVEGNLPAGALTGLDDFNRAIREAPSVGMPASAPAPADSPRAAAPMPALKSSTPDIDRAMQLLRSNQPGQALEILQKSQKQFPKSSELLALCGTAAYKADNLRLALEYWKESLDLKADPMVEGAYKAALREKDNDKSAEKTFGSRFTLRYDGAAADPETAHAMVAMLDEEFNRISTQLGCRADERIVAIVQTREAYMRTTGAPVWSGGSYDGKVHIPVLDKGKTDARTRQVFAHELVHACLANIGTWPSWLHEGLAQRLSGEPVHPGTWEAIEKLAKQGRLPRLVELGQGWGSKSTADAQIAYGLARTAVDLFFQYHSGLGIRNLMNNPEALPRITADLDRRIKESVDLAP